MAQATKLAMVILMQSDLDAAVEFYKQLGCVLVFHIKERWAEFDLNGIKIGLCPSPKPMEEFRTGIVFEVPDVLALHEAFKNKLTFLGEPTEAVHGIMVSLKDPGSNIIDLYQPTPEKMKALAEKNACAQKSKEDDCCKPREQACC